MNKTSIIFLVVLVIPLFIFVVWLMLQEKPLGWKALAVVILLIAVGVLQRLMQG